MEGRSMRTLIALLLLLPLATACSSGPIAKAQLDAEVKRLCAIDGGIKVYETVKLPPKTFDRYVSKKGFYLPTEKEATINDQYIYEATTTFIQSGNPSIRRYYYAVIRRLDRKVMGQLVIYGRVGGDMPGPWHDSSFSCPEFRSNIDIQSLVITRSSN
jgi:hypothetical protein